MENCWNIINMTYLVISTKIVPKYELEKIQFTMHSEIPTLYISLVL